MDYANPKTESLSIDDTATLLKFYYDYQKSKTEPVQIKEYTQKNNHFDFYLDGKQYTFYSEDAARIAELIRGISKPNGKFEMIKEKIMHNKEHQKETLDFVVKELNRKLNEFFEKRVSF